MGPVALVSFALAGAIAGVLALQLRGSVPGPPAAGGMAIDAALREHGAVGAIAGPLYTTYVVPFEITGILLLVAVVGAVVLAKRSV
jgi:NADH-quinone oxidoreductase subunit J